MRAPPVMSNVWPHGTNRDMTTSADQGTNEVHGGCACGQVRYEVASAPVQIVACHCSLCRRISGGPFSVYVVVREKDFRLTAGETSRYRATDRTTKHFCSSCGTPVLNSNPGTYKGVVMLYVGTTEDPRIYVPRLNIFCESKLDWVDPNEGSKVFNRSPGEA